MTRRSLRELSDDELRREADRLGMTVGRTLSRAQLIDLVAAALDDMEGSSSEPPAALDGGLEDLPGTVPTPTLARLLTEQGFDREAAAVARAVLRIRPGDSRAGRVLAALHEEGSARAGAPSDLTCPDDRPEPRPSLLERYGETIVLLLVRSSASLWAGWDVSPRDDENAAKAAGPGARRALRVFSARGVAGHVEARSSDLDIEGPSGEIVVTGCWSGAAHRAALGWRSADGSFAPSGHSILARTPPASVSRRARSSWSVAPAPAPVDRRGGLTTFLDRYLAIVTTEVWNVLDSAPPGTEERALPARGQVGSHPTSPGLA
jgi:hypothetical protein